MEKNFTKENLVSFKKNSGHKSGGVKLGWLKLLVFIGVLLFNVGEAKGTSWINWGDTLCFNVVKQQEYGRYAISIKLYDYSDDNQRAWVDVSAKCGNSSIKLAYLNCKWQNFRHGGQIDYYITSKIANKNSKGFVMVKDERNEGTSYRSLDYNKEERCWQIRNFKEGNIVTFYWYPVNADFGKNYSFNANGRVEEDDDDDGINGNDDHGWNHDDWIDNVGSLSLPNITPSVSVVQNSASGSYFLDVKMLDYYKYPSNQCSFILQGKFKDGQWIDLKKLDACRFESNTDENRFTINGTNQEYESGSLVSQQKWVDGLSIRVKALEYPDWSSSAYSTMYSSEINLNKVAAIKKESFNVTQINRNINLSWDMILPSSNDENQDKSNFTIEKYDYDNRQWVQIDEVPFNKETKSYSYNYAISDEECTKGKINYKFRLHRTSYPIGVWYQYMQAEKEILVNTDYKKVNIISINPDVNSSSAVVTWENVGNGILDKNEKLKIFLDGTLIGSPSYDVNEFKIGSLEGCKTYNVHFDVTVNDKQYQTTNDTIFRMPDNGARAITSFEASKGYYSKYVQLKWTVPSDSADFNYFALKRTPLDEDGATGEAVLLSQVESKGLTSYTYQDNEMEAGIIYRYDIIGYSLCDKTYTAGETKSSYGFCQPYATVSGRISYEGSQAVNGVCVSAEGTSTASKNKSLSFSKLESKSYVSIPKDVIDITKKDLTFQTWIRPNANDSVGTILDKEYNVTLTLNKDRSFHFYLLGNSFDIDNTILDNEWSQLSMCVNSNVANKEAHLIFYINSKVAVDTTVSYNNWQYDKWKDHNGEITIGSFKKGDNNFSGYMDEIRIWDAVLDSSIIAKNYNCYITGKEECLVAYYRCDEMGVKKLFDLSADGSNFNKNDGTLASMVSHNSSIVPSTEQLANKTYTDVDGNYIMSTIPYSSDGTMYNILPSLGVHEFNPSKRPIYASSDSRVFNSTDYTDVSSFDVQGYIYYENTSYPVQDASIKIDGISASKNGEVITTDNEGHFIVSVPIGDHFISVSKQGHSFVGEGRYPLDPNETGVIHTFDSELETPLYFWDDTKVVLTGRVVGGEVESAKAHGLGQSKANIGRAHIVLKSPVDGFRLNEVYDPKTGMFSENTKVLSYEGASKYTNSHAISGCTTDSAQFIYIDTDSLTGEFALEVPPIKLAISKVSIPSNDNISFNLSTSDIDLSNPFLTKTDSAYMKIGEQDSVCVKFEYLKALDATYVNPNPTITISDMGNADGAFGEKNYEYYNSNDNTKDNIEVYSVDEGADTIKYNYGYPIFVSDNYYKFKVSAFQTYKNCDVKGDTVYDYVPLKDQKAELNANFSSTTQIYIEDGSGKKAGEVASTSTNELTLDSIGEGVFKIKAGFPNIITPYTWGMNLYITNNGEKLAWNKNTTFKAYVFGGLPTGNNFVTSGPDKVLMILRDPCGTNSYSYINSGYSVTSSENTGGSFITENGVSTTTAATALTMTIAGTPIVGTITETESGADVNAGFSYTEGVTSSHTTTRTITTNEYLSTSSDPDFVGADGDVFMGSATNILFGYSNNVGFEKQTDGSYSIGLDKVLTTGSKFSTAFKYTQYYIVGTLLPNLDENKKSLIKTVSQADYDSYTNLTDKVIYVTTLDKSDPNFGTNNFDTDVWGDRAVGKDVTAGPSYKMVFPAASTETEKKAFQDDVRWYNSQICLWKDVLASNEKAKVDAFKSRDKWLDVNHSFSSGVDYESSVDSTTNDASSTEGNFETMAVLGVSTSAEIMGIGLSVDISTTATGNVIKGSGSETENSKKIGYVLAEDGDNDALTVDVFRAPDGFGPIFRTRGGQTTNPYEGEVKTSYYKPGDYTIMDATMQIEVPRITVDQASATDVPSGTSANYSLSLDNLSETGDDVWFKVVTNDASNPDGASLSIDGTPLRNGEGRKVLVKAGETLTKSLQLTQTQEDVLEYKDIEIILASIDQSDETSNHDVIADTVRISAQFVPSSTPVDILIDQSKVNSSVGDVLPIKIYNFNKDYKGLKSIKLQYEGQNDNSWKTIKEYVVSEDDKTDDNFMLDDATIYINLKMDELIYKDQTYKFRALSTTMFGDNQITAESKTVEVVKDMDKPKSLGSPNPMNGVLDNNNEVSLTFNEDILSGALATKNNFGIYGVLNAHDVSHDVSLSLTGEAIDTEARFSLAQSDFTIESWMKLDKFGGVFFEQGIQGNKFKVSVTDNGYLDVNIAGSDYVSENKLMTDKWMYLSVAYDYNENGSTISAHYATDADSYELFLDKAVVSYTGSGALSIGEGMNAKINELTIWNKKRSFTTSQAQMYTTKYANTTNLIGYWPMDEGRGNVATDKARGRNFILPNDSWSLSVDNKTLALDNGYAKLNTSKISMTSDESGMVEFWFQGAGQKDSSTLFSLGENDYLSAGFDQNGKLNLYTKNNTYEVCDDSLLDNAWHHFALNVIRDGSVSILVDGVNKWSIIDDSFPALSAAYLTLGAKVSKVGFSDKSYSNYFCGNFDDVRIWKGTFTADFIRLNMYNRLGGDEDGLVAYYPFEYKDFDGAGQLISVSTLSDRFKSDVVGTTGADDPIVSGNSFSDSAPALQDVRVETPVTFSYTASEREVVFTLGEQAMRIEGCSLTFMAKGIPDMNGNYSNPIVWTAYVNKNQLKWSGSNVSIAKEVGKDYEFNTSIINNSGDVENWEITNLPSWLSVSNNSGTLKQLTSRDLTFDVDPALSIGYYEATVYLSGNNQIDEDFVVSLQVTGEKPNWIVNSNDYEYSMNVVGSLKFNDVPSEDSQDLIAAFVGDSCVGVCSPEYYSRHDAYYCMMTVYGNSDMESREIEFKAWDASTGNIHPISVTQDNVMLFHKTSLVGSTSAPYVWNADENIEQEIKFNSNWNWVSLYVEPSDKSISAVFDPSKAQGLTIKNKESFVSANDNEWKGSLKTIDPVAMYKVNADKALEISAVGKLIDVANYPISLSSKWNWIGYTPSFTCSPNYALADALPSDGDIIKGQNAFAVYNKYEWEGSLKAMEPGEGYLYYSFSNDSKTFNFPSSKATQSLRSLSGVSSEEDSTNYDEFNIIDNAIYPGNMTVIGQVIDESGNVITDAIVAVYDAAGNCLTAMKVDDNDKLVYLTIPGEFSKALSFKVKKIDSQSMYDIDKSLTYKDDLMVGTFKEPYELSLNVTGINNSKFDDVNVYPSKVTNVLNVDGDGISSIKIYDASGILMIDVTDANAKNVVSTSCLSSGIYFVRVICNDGKVRSVKIVK